MITFEEWEARQMKRWRFRLACLLQEPSFRWERFKLRWKG